MEDFENDDKFTLTETAQLEIGINETRLEERKQLEYNWQQEREKIARSAASELPAGAADLIPRSLRATYNERWNHHGNKVDQMEMRYDGIRNSIRAAGTTVSNEFEAAAHDRRVAIPATREHNTAPGKNEPATPDSSHQLSAQTTTTPEANANSAPKSNHFSRSR